MIPRLPMPRSAALAVAEPAGELDEAELGPMMRALDHKRRRYVMAQLTLAPSGRRVAARAARMAGFGHPGSNSATLARIAHRLNSEERVQLAMKEHSERYLT